MKKLLFLSVLVLAGCVGRPENIVPVNNFETTRYLGKWYEIARLDHSFERGLSHVTADYSLRQDGGLKVLNRGYKEADAKWKEAEGKAYFVDKKDVGYLKVSFFGPFYGSYIVFDLDQQDYSYSMISGPDKSYLWLLSRTPTMDPALQQRLVEKARGLGFDTSKLIYVKQN
ncbi:lipocalin family protein [Janthinobacterium tructae]|uniref:lipocalin family protein n=1 Tax=Janthinobacterium tructae TaxID=2590869 RepID=UPI00249BB3BC|nr:lipocalin family protein [Janthinobacterium tructae]MDI3292958.1 lipocalin family protein [Janthinobacterium tructae]